jgi:HK97 family phage major capsid protein
MTATDANVRKIGTYFRISEEMLADTPQLTSYLSARAPEKLLSVEDDQILNGVRLKNCYL